MPTTATGPSWTPSSACPGSQRPTAAVCFTDYMAVSLAERLEYLGLSIPGDVALTGFDDIVPGPAERHRPDDGGAAL